MKEFNERVSCKKCGQIRFSNINPPKVKYIETGIDNPKEYLQITCGQCGYRWREKCLSDKD